MEFTSSNQEVNSSFFLYSLKGAAESVIILCKFTIMSNLADFARFHSLLLDKISIFKKRTKPFSLKKKMLD